MNESLRLAIAFVIGLIVLAPLNVLADAMK